MGNLCFTERPLQFSKIAHKSLGKSIPPSSLSVLLLFGSLFLSLAVTPPSPLSPPYLPPSACCRPAWDRWRWRRQASGGRGPGAGAQRGARAQGGGPACEARGADGSRAERRAAWPAAGGSGSGAAWMSGCRRGSGRHGGARSGASSSAVRPCGALAGAGCGTRRRLAAQR
jgi:hypothetical protein